MARYTVETSTWTDKEGFVTNGGASRHAIARLPIQTVSAEKVSIGHITSGGYPQSTFDIKLAFLRQTRSIPTHIRRFKTMGVPNE